MKIKGILFIVLILAVSFLTVSVAMAAGEGKTGEKPRGFWQRLLNYPAKVVEKSGTAVSDATKNTTKVVSTTVNEPTAVMTGESKQPERIVTEPVKQTADTIATAAKDTVSIPVEAAKATAEQAETK